MFYVIEVVQELALPLLLGAVVAMLLANLSADVYEYYFTSSCSVEGDAHHRMLGGGGGEGESGCDRWVLSQCAILGHEVTLHFVAK